MSDKKKTIGFGIEAPDSCKPCGDNKCPFSGKIKVRGRAFAGIVTSAKFGRSITVEWSRVIYNKKYERYFKKKSKIHAHNPECINAKEGDKVKVMECRPLSKTKNFVVVENIKKKDEGD